MRQNYENVVREPTVISRVIFHKKDINTVATTSRYLSATDISEHIQYLNHDYLTITE